MMDEESLRIVFETTFSEIGRFCGEKEAETSRLTSSGYPV